MLRHSNHGNPHLREGAVLLLGLLQVSFGLQVSFEESEQAEVFPTVLAAVGRGAAVDAAVSDEAGGQVEGF